MLSYFLLECSFIYFHFIGKAEKQRVHLTTALQMSATARSGPGGIQEPGTQPGPPMRVAGTQALNPCLLPPGC